MEALPHNEFALLFTVFLLGARHGLDPDHLATIDGLARLTALPYPRLARWSGLLFSLGHGVVVTSAAVAISIFAQQWSVPVWFEVLGITISVTFLLVLGTVNLRAVWRSAAGQLVPLQGVKARWIARWVRARHPAQLIGIGALFALSFDTLSQTAMFSVAASALAGSLFAALVGITFTLGMIATDTLNSLWITHLIARADQRAVVVSRALALMICAASFLIAAWSLLAVLG